MDAHIDTVGIGNIKLWDYDPYRGYEDEDIILGRGASGSRRRYGFYGICRKNNKGYEA